MNLFNENIDKLQETLLYAKYRLEKTYDPNEALFLYDFVTKLSEFTKTEIKLEKNIALAVGLYKRNRYLKDCYKNFIASPDFVKELYNVVRINLENILEQNNLKTVEDTVKINEYYMFGNIHEYYEQLSDPNREYLFFSMKDKIYDCNNCSKQNHIFDDIYGKNGIFVNNDNDVSAMANIVYELEHIFKKYNLSMISNKAINEYVYYSNFNEVDSLIAKKLFLDHLNEKNSDLYNEGIKKAYLNDYIYTLKCFDLLQMDNIKSEDYIRFIKSLNFITGEFLSDIYLSLDCENRETFSKFLNVRSTKLLRKDVFDKLLDLTGGEDYLVLAEISKKQIKKNIK